MLPDYLIEATLLHYGPDAAALVSETICRWEHDKWPEENSFLAVELYRQAYPYQGNTRSSQGERYQLAAG